MRKFAPALIFLALLTGCQVAGVRSFWKTHSIDYTDIQAAQDQFADFAELAAAAPLDEALEAVDVLFDKLKQDTVGYYIYCDFVDAAFYNILSPCRSAAIYSKAVDRMLADGILTPLDYRPYLQRREWILYNVPGGMATVPGAVISGRTLVLVIDKGCPSCREALGILSSSPEWEGLRHIAVCLGYGPSPDIPGWEYLEPENASAVFDTGMTPIYFVAAADGTVETGYTLAL